MNKQLDWSKFKVEYISAGTAWGYCIFHNDKHTPNLSITLDGVYAGRYYCWACGASGTLADTQNIVKLDKKKKRTRVFTNWNKVQRYYNKVLNRFPLIKLAFANRLNVDVNSLDAFNIGYNGSAYTVPMYLNCFYISGIQKQYPDRKKVNMRGSKLGLFIPPNMDCMEIEKIYLCEGFSDTVSVYDLGYNAIGLPSCGFSKLRLDNILVELFEGDPEWYDDGGLSLRNIVIIPDNNKESIDYSYSLKHYLDINISIFEYSGAKDIREYIFKKGKSVVSRELGRL